MPTTSTTTRRRRSTAAASKPPRQRMTRPAIALCGWAFAQVLASGLFVGTCELKTAGFGQCRMPWAVFLLSVVSSGQMSVGLVMEAFRLPQTAASVLNAAAAAAAAAAQAPGAPPVPGPGAEIPPKPRRRSSRPES